LWDAAQNDFFSVSEGIPDGVAASETQAAHSRPDVARASQLIRELKRRLVALLPPDRYWLDTAYLVAPLEETAPEQQTLREAAELAGWTETETLSATTAATCYENWLCERAAANDPVAAQPEPETGLACGAAFAASRNGMCYLLHPRQPQPQQRQDFALELQLCNPPRTATTDYLLTGCVRARIPQLLAEGSSLFIQDDTQGLVQEVFLDQTGQFGLPLTLTADTENPFTLSICDGAGAELASCRLSIYHGRQRNRQQGNSGRNEASPAEPDVDQRSGQDRQALQHDWKEFARLVRHCLILSGQVADRTGRNREELFEQVYSQERYAEQAFAEGSQALYRECFDNLKSLAAYLEQLR
jgi:hypothetical protein